MFTLKFPEHCIQDWADKNTDQKYVPFQNDIGPSASRCGYLEKKEFLKLCAWKSERPKLRCEANTSDFIREVTTVSFATTNEQLRIEVLTILAGVEWPTASVILHFCKQDLYPILDFRALWSLGIEKTPAYNFAFWETYSEYCRSLAQRNNVSMRTLDRALWMYSKQNQK